MVLSIKIEQYISEHPDFNIKILKNEKKITPYALNIGVKNSNRLFTRKWLLFYFV